ncbi:MAG: hypothetical protein J0M05_08330 [Candidatus Kapabacteria bacterium]|nr:hypothetical protein [Candidatus Kapabacteria bacterium]
MRIRTIKPQFFHNEDLAEMPMAARLFFIGLWTLADSEGRLEDRPRRIKAELFPYDNIDADDLLSRLQSAGFIIRYTSSGGQNTERGFCEMKVIQIVNFKKHQRLSGREAEYESDFPPPPDLSQISETPVLQESALEATEINTVHNEEAIGKNVEATGKHSGKMRKNTEATGKNMEREKDQEKERERNKERIYKESAENSDELPSSGISTLIYSQDALDFAAWFKTLLPKAQKVSQSNLKDWAKTYDDCIRLDSRARDEILAVCEWARADTFWSANFQSASKLRQKNKTGVQYFDVFLQQMNKNNGTARNIHNGTATRSFGTIADAQREHDDFLAAGAALIANGQVAR